MNAQDVKTYGDFGRFLSELAQFTAATYDHSLEAYLSALWTLVQPHQHTEPSFTLFAELLKAACFQAPPPFDPDWLRYTEYPSPSLTGDHVGDYFAELQQTLLFHIADLHRMAEAGTLDAPGRWFGIDSPTGHRWYNFEVADFLEAASAPIDPDVTYTTHTWEELADTIVTGGIYE